MVDISTGFYGFYKPTNITGGHHPVLSIGICLMWVNQCHKLPMAGNGNHTTYKECDLGDGLLLFYPN